MGYKKWWGPSALVFSTGMKHSRPPRPQRRLMELRSRKCKVQRSIQFQLESFIPLCVCLEWGCSVHDSVSMMGVAGAYRMCTSVTCASSCACALAWQTARTPSASVCLSSKSRLSTKHTEDLWSPPPPDTLSLWRDCSSLTPTCTPMHTRALLLSDQIQPRARRPGELIIFIKSSWSRRMDFLTSFKGWFSSCPLIPPPQLWPPMMGPLLVSSFSSLIIPAALWSSFQRLIAPHGRHRLSPRSIPPPTIPHFKSALWLRCTPPPTHPVELQVLLPLQHRSISLQRAPWHAKNLDWIRTLLLHAVLCSAPSLHLAAPAVSVWMFFCLFMEQKLHGFPIVSFQL